MDNKELLELAALAAGYNIGFFSARNQSGFICGFTHAKDSGDWNPLDNDGDDWNPLDNDGDALRLAVKLELSIDFAKWCNTVYYGVDNFVQEDWHNKDPYAATRLAIVRAAAEIGKSMKVH